MTGIEDRRVSRIDTPVRIDAVSAVGLTEAAQVKAAQPQQFWSSSQRSINSSVVEMLEVSFGTPRLVNLISFDVSRFPCILGAEWSDGDDQWTPFEYGLAQNAEIPTPVRALIHQQVGLVVTDSIPAVVNSARGTGHPQHFGTKHWVREEWRTNPVRAAKVRFTLRRNPDGVAPVSPRGEVVDYSLAMKSIKVGYRVTSGSDVPKGLADGEDWESSRDMLGSTVSYSLYRQGADRAIDYDEKTSWRSEPQPVNYAVVPLYVDMRDETGEGQTIDRFFVDPVTTGVHCNLYFTDDVPADDFFGSDTPVPVGRRDETGDVALDDDGSILFANTEPVGVSISPVFASINEDAGWWVGVDAVATVGVDDADPHPIVSIGGGCLSQQGGSLRFVPAAGAEVDLPLPASHIPGARFKVVVSHLPTLDVTGEHVRISYVNGPDVAEAQMAMDLSGFSSIKIGLNPDPESTEAAAMKVLGLVVKQENLSPETEQWFFDEGEAYVDDDQTLGTSDRHTNTNAVLRMHPVFITATNRFGVVGGDWDRLSHAVWRPIDRDYILHKGYIEFRPVRAKFWKLEFTQLSPRIFETNQTLNRTVLCFPPSVVDAHDQVGPKARRDFAPHGIQTMVDRRTEAGVYADALTTLRNLADVSPETVQALVVKDPHLAEQVAETGWIWQYQPWHTGSLSPRWSEPGVHHYERISIRHKAKVAYFVGIKELIPHRTDPSQTDDTPEYVERFLDDTYLQNLTNLDMTHQGVVATTSRASVESTLLSSYLDIYGVQFASQETGPIQVLTDPDFLDEAFDTYEAYGDASVTRIGPNRVEVVRGFTAITYGELELLTFGEMEAKTFGELEGLLPGASAADGGMRTSKPYTPMGAGRVLAKVKVSTKSRLSAPIDVEIVSASTSQVLGAARREVVPGIPTEITASFAGESLTDRQTYGDLEAYTFEELEGFTFARMEAATGLTSEVLVRIRQQDPSNDVFTVHRVALYDEPVVWSFSVDDGATWWQAFGVANDPNAVLAFPEPGSRLRWRADLNLVDSTVSSLHIRPWYGSGHKPAPPFFDMEQAGPQQSGWDTYPSLPQHPMWQPHAVVEVIPSVLPESDPPTIWRNLVPNPSAEGPYLAQWEPEGGTVTVQTDWPAHHGTSVFVYTAGG